MVDIVECSVPVVAKSFEWTDHISKPTMFVNRDAACHRGHSVTLGGKGPHYCHFTGCDSALRLMTSTDHQPR